MVPTTYSATLGVFTIIPGVGDGGKFYFTPFVRFLVRYNALVNEGRGVHCDTITHKRVYRRPDRLGTLVSGPVRVFVQEGRVNIFTYMTGKDAREGASIFGPFRDYNTLFGYTLTTTRVIFLFVTFG